MRRRVRGAGVFGFAALLLLTGNVGEGRAQEETEQAEVAPGRVFELGEIEVVGKQEENRNKTIDKVYEDEMLLFDRYNLADAVNLLPGVTLSEFGARNETMVYVRGFDIKHVPVFLDGIPIYVPYDGYPDLSRFSTFDLSEVVVSKGFTSVLYGPNTMGGAINMVSRKPQKGFEMNAGAGFGSGEAYSGFANVGSNQGKWYIQLGGSYLDKDHFRVADDFEPTLVQPSGERINSYRNDWKINVKVGLTPNATDEYALSYINQQAEKGDPPYTGIDPRERVRWWQWRYWDKQSVYFNSNTAICDKSYVKTRLYYDIFENSLFSYDDNTYSTITFPYAFRSWYDDYTYGGSIEGGTQFLPRNFLKLAFHYKDDVHRESNEGRPSQRFEDRIISIGLEDTIDVTSRLYSIIGASYDRSETVEAQDVDLATMTLKSFKLGEADAFNPQGGLFYKVTDTGTVHASVAMKSRMPSIKDKFSYRLGTALPNPDLKPEEAINYELGYQDLLFKKLTVEANLFYSDISDFILLTSIPNPSDPSKVIDQNLNVGKVKQYGLEIGVSGQILSCLKGGFNYTYLQYINESTPDKLLDLPHNKVFAYLQYFTPLKGLSLLGSVEFNGDRYSSVDRVRQAKQYALVDAKAIYEFYKGISIEGGVNNLTDEDYALEEGYPMEGRNYFVNLRYRF